MMQLCSYPGGVENDFLCHLGQVKKYWLDHTPCMELVSQADLLDTRSKQAAIKRKCTLHPSLSVLDRHIHGMVMHLRDLLHYSTHSANTYLGACPEVRWFNEYSAEASHPRNGKQDTLTIQPRLRSSHRTQPMQTH